MKKVDFLKDFWGKEKVEVEADALKDLLQVCDEQFKEIERLANEVDKLKKQVVYYRDKAMSLEAKAPLFIDLRG